MLINQIEIKDNILNKLKFFDNGFSDLFLDYTAERIVSYENDTSIAYGVDDRFGNYFYLRNDGNIQISKSNEIVAHISNLELKNPVVLVAVVSDANPNELLKCLLNALGTFNEIEIQRAFITNEKVITSEYSFLKLDAQKSILARLGNKTLIKIGFTMFENFQPNDRECFDCNPCKDCYL